MALQIETVQQLPPKAAACRTPEPHHDVAGAVLGGQQVRDPSDAENGNGKPRQRHRYSCGPSMQNPLLSELK